MAKPISEIISKGTIKGVKLRQSDTGHVAAGQAPETDSEEDDEESSLWETEKYVTTALVNLASVMEVRFSSVVRLDGGTGSIPGH
jgi:hypothetical protein